MISWNKIVIAIIGIGLYTTIHAQTVRYYQLTKTKVDGKVTTHNKGGQFICIYGDFCYDCDKNGKGVGNGQLQLKSKGGEYVTYFGESFFGKNSYYKFNKSFSNLNIITPKGDIYAYRSMPFPSSINTCSLIKKRTNSSPSSYSTPVYSNGNVSTQDNTKSNSNNSKRQKTKVKKRCAYCSGKGERIQHEYVSTFGQSGPRVYCSKCNQSWNYGTLHAHHRCNHCSGTGVYEYEY